MTVLIACEFSGIVRDAFLERGHDAVSCDILPTERPGPHLQCPVEDLDLSEFSLLIAHPPCTHLAVSGARWWKDRRREQEEAIAFFMHFADADCPRVCIENPVGIMSRVYRPPDQYVQPWQFGHGETKKTGLWLRGLPKLRPTDVVEGREPRIHHMAPGKERWRNRSRSYTGMAEAMASQWGPLLVEDV